VRNTVIQPYNYVIQYKSLLKTERYEFVQVVLLFSLLSVYQDLNLKLTWNMEVGTSQRVVLYSVVQKITEQVTDRYFPIPQTNNQSHYNNLIKGKCPSVIGNRWLHSREMFTAVEDPKSETSSEKYLYSRKEELVRHHRRELSIRRVFYDFKEWLT